MGIQGVNVILLAPRDLRPHCSEQRPLLRLAKKIAPHLAGWAVDNGNLPLVHLVFNKKIFVLDVLCPPSAGEFSFCL